MIDALFALLSGEDLPPDAQEEIALALRELESALAELRLARGSWSGPGTIDVAAVRRALDLAERQLDAARVRLTRAEARRGGRGPSGTPKG